jgi:hypothetical protein
MFVTPLVIIKDAIFNFKFEENTLQVTIFSRWLKLLNTLKMNYIKSVSLKRQTAHARTNNLQLTVLG